MNTISYLPMFIFLLIVTSIHADKKWIPIEPLNTSTNTQHVATQPDINISQIQPLNKLVENAKVIKQLIDSVNSTKKPNIESEKKWYILDNTQNNQ